VGRALNWLRGGRKGILYWEGGVIYSLRGRGQVVHFLLEEKRRKKGVFTIILNKKRGKKKNLPFFFEETGN